MPKHPDRYYNRTREAAVKGIKGELIKETEFTAGGITEREFYVKVNSSIERTGMFFHAKRVYVIIAILPEEEIDGEPINAFMNSFAVKDIDIAAWRND